MSKALTKEDVDPPERSGRVRSASGLPPGAANYITVAGAQRLRDELARLRRAPAGEGQRIDELERILASITVVELPNESDKSVSFGARVTLQDASHQLTTYRILGVDELDFDADAVSWISPTGRTLLAAKVGDRVILGDAGPATIVKVEYPPA